VSAIVASGSGGGGVLQAAATNAQPIAQDRLAQLMDMQPLHLVHEVNATIRLQRVGAGG
jgi:hypothetical protein